MLAKRLRIPLRHGGLLHPSPHHNMRRRPLAQHGLPTHNRISKPQHRPTHTHHPRPYRQLIVVTGGQPISHIGLDHRDTAPIFALHRLVIQPHLPDQLHAPHLEPDQVVRVIDDAHLIGLRVAHANPCLPKCQFRTCFDHTRKSKSNHRHRNVIQPTLPTTTLNLMRVVALLPLILATASLAQTAPPAEQETPFTLRTTSNIVFVPAQVQTRQGEMIYTLKPEQFVLTDNGVPQKIHVDEDVDSLGLSLVVAVQCSRAAFDQFNNIRGLAAMIDDITGGAPRQVAVVSYGGEPVLLGDFTSDPALLIHNLNQLQPCDESAAAHLDAVAYSTSLLNDLAARQNSHNRQAILLISETRDHGSHARPADVIAGLGRSNTVLDAVSYNPGRTDILESLFHGRMGPGPIGLLVSAVQAVRKNVPHTLASLSGGEYVNFSGQHGFDDGLHSLANHIHNYYLLSFQTPSTNPVGLHRLSLTVPDYPDARLHYRLSYYSGEDPPPTLPGDDKDDKDSKDKKDDKHKF